MASYQRLQQDIWFDGDDYDDIRGKIVGRSLRSSSRLKIKFHIRRKLKVKIPNLNRFLRRKARLVKLAWIKVYKRLKESRAHFGDLFAGNYLVMQVSPTPLKTYGNKWPLVKGQGYLFPRIAN